MSLKDIMKNDVYEDEFKTFDEVTAEDITNLFNKYSFDIVFDSDDIENKRMAEKHMFDLFNKDFPKGLKNVPSSFPLYRILFIMDKNKIDKNQIGIHWTYSPDTFSDETFLENLYYNMGLRHRYTNPSYSLINKYVIIGKFNLNDINIHVSLRQQLLYPYEYEMTVKKDRKPSEAYLVKMENFNRNNPLNSNKIKRFI